MGVILLARCSACDYETSVGVGVGFGDADGQSFWWPYSCGHCREVLAGNALAAVHPCEDCGREMQAIATEVIAARAPEDMVPDPDELPGNHYRCPRCGDDSLVFEEAGMWD